MYILRHPEDRPMRYDYALAHESLMPATPPKRKWRSDYTLSRFEILALMFVMFAPAIVVWWWL